MKTDDIYSILEKIFNNDYIDKMEMYNQFRQELNNYLLDKLLYFKLENINYTIDNDFSLIIDTFDELIPNMIDKIYFFTYISNCIICFLSIIKKINIKWIPIDDKSLYQNPAFVNVDDTIKIYTDARENPSHTTKLFYLLLEKAFDKQEIENTYTNTLRQ